MLETVSSEPFFGIFVGLLLLRIDYLSVSLLLLGEKDHKTNFSYKYDAIQVVV